MAAALLTLYYKNSAFLILVVLLQSGRGGGLGEFGGGGGGGSSAVFGSRGTSSLLQKLTVYSATTFMVLSIALAIHASRQSDVGRGEIVAEEMMAPSIGTAPAPLEIPAEDPATSFDEAPAQAPDELEVLEAQEDLPTSEDQESP